MKARIISTGEIMNIADYARVTLDKYDDYGNPIEVPFNDVELLKEPLNTIDWQQVRIQSAIAAMQGMCASKSFFSLTNECIPQIAVKYADSLVKELKGG